MIRRPPRSTLDRSSAASDVYKRQVRETLDAFAAARATAAGRGVRFSISHLQLIEPSDWPRFAALDVFASFQLLWAQPNPYSIEAVAPYIGWLLYTSDAADERSRVGLGGRRIIQKKK